MKVMKEMKVRFKIWRARRLERSLGKLWKDLLPEGAKVQVESEKEPELQDNAFLFGLEERPSPMGPLKWYGEPIPMSQIVGSATLSKEDRVKQAQNTLEQYGPIEERRELYPANMLKKDGYGFQPATFPLSTVE